jgi:hypothetical protein
MARQGATQGLFHSQIQQKHLPTISQDLQDRALSDVSSPLASFVSADLNFTRQSQQMFFPGGQNKQDWVMSRLQWINYCQILFN